MIQILMGILIVAGWCVGYSMAKREGDDVIGYRETEIKSLRHQLETTDNYVDTLFNETDMVRIGQVGYIAGMRHDENWSAEKWIADTFTSTETTEI